MSVKQREPRSEEDRRVALQDPAAHHPREHGRDQQEKDELVVHAQFHDEEEDDSMQQQKNGPEEEVHHHGGAVGRDAGDLELAEARVLGPVAVHPVRRQQRVQRHREPQHEDDGAEFDLVPREVQRERQIVSARVVCVFEDLHLLRVVERGVALDLRRHNRDGLRPVPVHARDEEREEEEIEPRDRLVVRQVHLHRCCLFSTGKEGEASGRITH